MSNHWLNKTALTLKNILKKTGVVQGLGDKRLSILLEKMRSAAPGEICKEVVVRGLPTRNGRSPKVKSRVQNTLGRMLQPPKSGDTAVDMRHLGNIIGVKVGTELRRMPANDY